MSRDHKNKRCSTGHSSKCHRSHHVVNKVQNEPNGKSSDHSKHHKCKHRHHKCKHRHHKCKHRHRHHRRSEDKSRCKHRKKSCSVKESDIVIELENPPTKPKRRSNLQNFPNQLIKKEISDTTFTNSIEDTKKEEGVITKGGWILEKNKEDPQEDEDLQEDDEEWIENQDEDDDEEIVSFSRDDSETEWITHSDYEQDEGWIEEWIENEDEEEVEEVTDDSESEWIINSDFEQDIDEMI